MRDMSIQQNKGAVTMKEMKFKGYDWSELFTFFDLESFGDDSEDLEKLQDYLKKHQEEECVVMACRKYVKALADQSYKYNYCGPVWSGLSMVEDDNTFIHHFIQLLPLAWS